MKTASASASTQSLWRERVLAWRASGQSAAQFARGRAFTASSLLSWSSRLRRADAPTFVRLVPRSSTATDAASPSLVLDVAGARIHVAPGFDRALLAQVVAALREGAQ